jgi:hypothetical protein
VAAAGSGKKVSCARYLASLVETCKLNAVDPQRHLTDLLIRLING